VRLVPLNKSQHLLVPPIMLDPLHLSTPLDTPPPFSASISTSAPIPTTTSTKADSTTTKTTTHAEYSIPEVVHLTHSPFKSAKLEYAYAIFFRLFEALSPTLFSSSQTGYLLACHNRDTTKVLISWLAPRTPARPVL
jgi:hypothetical protein